MYLEKEYPERTSSHIIEIQISVVSAFLSVVISFSCFLMVWQRITVLPYARQTLSQTPHCSPGLTSGTLCMTKAGKFLICPRSEDIGLLTDPGILPH